MFDNLYNLENLGLRRNQLKNLPKGIFDNLYNLEEVTLHDNQLTSLPA
ncbi:MAG: leucine-rich repeat domain-containing protein [Candidatus Peribacteria bacterium]|nr:leucine-rich repeat domain-containing protein [Candidatus Peribacteria bacterium]